MSESRCSIGTPLWSSLTIELTDLNQAQRIVNDVAFFYSARPLEIMRMLYKGMKIPLITGALLQIEWLGVKPKLVIKSNEWDGADLDPFRSDYTQRFSLTINDRVIVKDCWSLGPVWRLAQRALESIPVGDVTLIIRDHRSGKTRIKCVSVGIAQWIIYVH